MIKEKVEEKKRQKSKISTQPCSLSKMTCGQKKRAMKRAILK